MNELVLSQEAKKNIKKFEGCKLEAYKCPSGRLTIGYGHTNKVFIDDKITQEEAEILFEQDIIIHENNVKKLVKVPLSQNQFDALVSLEYNIGYNNFANSTILKLLNAGDYTGAANCFLRENICAKTPEERYQGSWVFNNEKKVLLGLVERRLKEKKMFLKTK